jgi:two-component system sensor histidine kinase HydH
LPQRTPTRSAARWGLLVSALILGIMLIVFSVAAWRQSRALADTIALGQSERLIQELGQASRREGRPPTRAFLEAYISGHEAEGLRFVGFFSPGGDPELSAGTPLRPITLEEVRGQNRNLWVGTRMRIIRQGPPPEEGPRRRRDGPPGDEPFPVYERDHRRPGPLEGPRPPDEARRHGRGPDDPGAFPPPDRERDRPGQGPDDPGASPPADGAPRSRNGTEIPGDGPGPDGAVPDRPGDRPPHGSNRRRMVLEVEPLVVQDLQRRATYMVMLGSASALVLMVSALFFMRQSLRAEEMERSLESQRRLAALGEMSAILAHEIKNPLAALKGHAQLLEEGLEPGSRARRKSERVVQEAMRLERLVHQLLDFVRSGRVERAPVDIAELAREAAEAVDADRIDLRIDPGLSAVALDRDQIFQVLTNLLRNALQASAADGRVELAISTEAGRLRLEVLDRGEGIPPGEEEAIFEPFRTHRAKGVGLGLAVARRIVEMHDGTIKAANREGGGAAFRLELPAG